MTTLLFVAGFLLLQGIVIISGIKGLLSGSRTAYYAALYWSPIVLLLIGWVAKDDDWIVGGIIQTVFSLAYHVHISNSKREP
ncbi:hypothetical protein ACFJIX_13480 [Roseateles sp. UC29_93]|uniref:hypothetical protein n=1 Tax=Roseateles sp. UC29_93 TaxID=3350177 RepID=UPI00366E681B